MLCPLFANLVNNIVTKMVQFKQSKVW